MNHPSPLVFMDTGYTLFFDMACEHVAYLLWACIFSLFLLFFIAHTINNMESDHETIKDFLFHGLMVDNANSQCRNFAHEHGHVLNLDHKV